METMPAVNVWSRETPHHPDLSLLLALQQRQELKAAFRTDVIIHRVIDMKMIISCIQTLITRLWVGNVKMED